MRSTQIDTTRRDRFSSDSAFLSRFSLSPLLSSPFRSSGFSSLLAPLLSALSSLPSPLFTLSSPLSSLLSPLSSLISPLSSPISHRSCLLAALSSLLCPFFCFCFRPLRSDLLCNCSPYAVLKLFHGKLQSPKKRKNMARDGPKTSLKIPAEFGTKKWP